MGDPAIPLPHVLEALTRGWSNGELMRAAQPDGIQAMGGTNRSRGEVFWDSRRGADLPVAELLATCAMRLGAVRFAVLQRNVNHGFTIAVTTRDHLVLSWVYTDWPCASTGYPMTAPQLRLPRHVFPQRPFQREHTI